ncbi:ABC transporter substrate-binding protein [Natronoglycomyces albus]|uniref:Solute-binding protein family 5 domain-containing protein n=1 Tax=Natronoglycomyces albus TaxID=2811108 RepID=A0A895XME0_9ACTN|nr:ABC transporter substrate-binding protein [Natronoglycomyces albus]QSB04703.1 hypothetical protein JQS30_13125 [Natronoglycomyces albus]
MFRKKKTVLGVSAAASAALLLSACGGSGSNGSSAGVGFEDCDENPTTCNSGEAFDGEELVWGLDSGWASWSEVHGAYGQSAGDVLEPVAPRIGYFDQNADFHYNTHILTQEPELINEDPMQVQYHLNPEGTWGDGTPIGLDDFIYNWYAWSGNEDFCDEQCEPRSLGWGPHVEDITEGEEDNTIVISYNEGYQTPEWMVATVLTNPAHLAEEYGFEDWKTDPEVMGESLVNFVNTVPEYTAGPYKIVDADMGDYVSYEINEEYAGDVQPTLSNIRMEVFSDTSAIITELRQGTIHGATPGRFDPDDISTLDGVDGIRYNVAAGPGWSHFDLNTESRFLSDVELRKAVLTAVDIEEILNRTTRLTQEDAERALNHFFRNDDPDYFVDLYEGSTQGTGDVEAARAILEEAGYTWEGDTLTTEDGDAVELEYRLPAEGDNAQTTAELFQAYLSEIGIDVSLSSFADGELTEVLMEQQFDVVSFQWIGSPTFATGPTQLFSGGSGSNFGGWANDDFDELAAQVLSTTDVDEAAGYANEAGKILVEEGAYVLPIAASPALILISEDLVNVRDNWASQQRGVYNIAEWGWAEEG